MTWQQTIYRHSFTKSRLTPCKFIFLDIIRLGHRLKIWRRDNTEKQVSLPFHYLYLHLNRRSTSTSPKYKYKLKAVPWLAGPQDLKTAATVVEWFDKIKYRIGGTLTYKLLLQSEYSAARVKCRRNPKEREKERFNSPKIIGGHLIRWPNKRLKTPVYQYD